jgi:hypothetical protein
MGESMRAVRKEQRQIVKTNGDIRRMLVYVHERTARVEVAKRWGHRYAEHSW